MATQLTVEKLMKLLSSANVESRPSRLLDADEYKYRERILTEKLNKYLDILQTSYWPLLSEYAPHAVRHGSLWDLVVSLRREEAESGARDLGQLADYLVTLGGVVNCLHRIEGRPKLNIIYCEITYDDPAMEG